MIGPVKQHPYMTLMATETHEQRMARIMADRHLLLRTEGDPDEPEEDEGPMTTVGEAIAAVDATEAAVVPSPRGGVTPRV